MISFSNITYDVLHNGSISFCESAIQFENYDIFLSLKSRSITMIEFDHSSELFIRMKIYLFHGQTFLFDRFRCIDALLVEHFLSNFPSIQLVKQSRDKHNSDKNQLCGNDIASSRKRKLETDDRVNPPMSARDIYYNEKKSIMKEDNPEFTLTYIRSICYQQWRVLDDDLRHIYKERYRAKKNQYDNATKNRGLAIRKHLVSADTPSMALPSSSQINITLADEACVAGLLHMRSDC